MTSSYYYHARQDEVNWAGQLGIPSIHDPITGRIYLCISAPSTAGWCVPIALILVTHFTLTCSFTDDFSAEHPNDSESPDLLSSTVAAAPAPTAAMESSKNATAASNGTVKASHVSSAAAVATTASSPLNSTNDPNICHKPYKVDPEGVKYIDNPFCKPFEGQEVYPNIQYQGTSRLPPMPPPSQLGNHLPTFFSSQ